MPLPLSRVLIFDSYLLLINIVIIVLYNYLSEKNYNIIKGKIAFDENSMTCEIIQQEEELAILRHDLKNIVSSIDFYGGAGGRGRGGGGGGGVLIARLQDVYQLTLY